MTIHTMVSFAALLLCFLPVFQAFHRPIPYVPGNIPYPEFVPLETVAVREMGKAMVVTYYADTFRLHNVTLDAVRRTGKTWYEEKDNADETYVHDIVVSAAGIAAELVFYSQDQDLMLQRAHPLLHTAYSILYRYRAAHRVLTGILMEDKRVTADMVTLYMSTDNVEEEISM